MYNNTVKTFLRIVITIICIFTYQLPINAATATSMVFISFQDYSAHKELNSDVILSDVIINRICNIPGLVINERNVTDENLKLEQKIAVSQKKVEDAIKSEDFDTIFEVSKNKTALKKEGEYLPSEYTRQLGKNYGVSHIVLGSVDSIREGKRSKGTAWNNLNFSHDSQKVEIDATIKIIRADDGMVVWARSTTGTSKNRFNNIGKVAVGTKASHNYLFYDALEEIADNIAKMLKEDMTKKTIKL